jgi:hypothetical protein
MGMGKSPERTVSRVSGVIEELDGSWSGSCIGPCAVQHVVCCRGRPGWRPRGSHLTHGARLTAPRAGGEPVFWIVHLVGALPPGRDHLSQGVFIALSPAGLLLPVRPYFRARGDTGEHR